jgi:hypothetical protein
MHISFDNKPIIITLRNNLFHLIPIIMIVPMRKPQYPKNFHQHRYSSPSRQPKKMIIIQIALNSGIKLFIFFHFFPNIISSLLIIDVIDTFWVAVVKKKI